METEDIVTELYALRAGLSLIAKENDMCDAEIAAAENKKNTAIGAAEYRKTRAVENARMQINNALSNADLAGRRLESLERQVAAARENAVRCKIFCEDNEEYLEKSEKAEKNLAKSKRAVPLQIFAAIMFTLLHIAAAVMLWTFESTFAIAFAGGAILCTDIIEIVVAVKNKDRLYCFAHNNNSDTDKHYVWVYIVNIVLYVATTVCFILIANGILIDNGNESDTLLLRGVVHGFAMLFSLVCIIVTWIFHNIYKLIIKEDVRDCDSEVDRRNKALKDRDRLRQESEDASRAYEEAKKEYCANKDFLMSEKEKTRNSILKTEAEAANANMNVMKEYTFERANAERECAAAVAAAKETHGNISAGIWETLVDTYGRLLDARDWKILDLVIWQLETGRAETVKEALQLADRETQTDRIVATMQSASMAIAQRIDDGFGNLQTQLNKNFYSLARTLASAASNISYRIQSGYARLEGKMEQGYDALAERIDDNAREATRLHETQMERLAAADRNMDKLFSEQSLQTALLEKSDRSSRELMDAVKKLREGQSSV